MEKTGKGILCLRQEWKVKDSKSGDELLRRMGEVAEAEGHHPDLHLRDDNTVLAELSTHAIGMQQQLEIVGGRGSPRILSREVSGGICTVSLAMSQLPCLAIYESLSSQAACTCKCCTFNADHRY